MLSALLVLVAIYATVIAFVWTMQERLVWLPPGIAVTPEGDVRRIAFTADDGQPLHAFLVGDPARSRGLVMHFHGNADLATWLVPWGEEVYRRSGWAVLLTEYRGYGGLGGRPDYESSRRDAIAAYNTVRTTLAVPHDRVAFYGHSLGSAVAAELASEHPPRVLLLEAPFTSARAMARRVTLVPVGFLWRFIARVQFDTRAVVADLDAPVWVAHGARDGVIPARMGREVYAAARVKGELLIVDDAGHNDLSHVAGDAYWRWIDRALNSPSRETPVPASAPVVRDRRAP